VSLYIWDMLSIDAFLLISQATSTPMMLISQGNGTILAANQAACDLLEYDAAFLHGKTTIDLSLWQRTEDCSALMLRLKTEAQIDMQRAQLRTASSAVLEVSLSIRHLTIAAMDCLVVTLTDLDTELALAKQSQTAKHQLQKVLRSESQFVWRYELESSHWYLSHDSWQMLGYETEKSVAHDFAELVHPEDKPSMERFVSSVNSPDHANYVHLRIAVHAQGYRWFRLQQQNTVYGAEGDRPVRLIGTLDDVHEEMISQLERQRFSDSAVLAMNTVGLGLWESPADTNSIWDAQTYRLYGYSPETDRLPLDIFTEALSDQEFFRVSRLFGKSFKYTVGLSIEFQIRWPDGQLHWLAAKGQPVLNSLGKMTALRGVSWDVTEEHVVRELLQSQRHELSLLTRKLLEQEKVAHRKLAMALHDQLGQTLTAARLMHDHAAQSQPSGADVRLSNLLDQAHQQVRVLLMDLRPPMLEEQGLAAALENEIRRVLIVGGVTDVFLEKDGFLPLQRFPEEVEYAFFMVAREALANAMAHAQAKLIWVSLMGQGQGQDLRLSLRVTDDGVGFPVEPIAFKPGHLGLIGMRERAVAVNAQLSFASSATDGTVVELTWGGLH